MFGDDLFVAPVGAPVDDNGLAAKDIYFPPGNWVGFFTGELVAGGVSTTSYFTLSETPLYAKLGSIIPLRFPNEAFELGNAEKTPSGIVLKAFVCNSNAGQGSLYDDDGKSIAYEVSSDIF